jgi:outer membrane receptor protein involved in Fe transport
VSTETVGGYVDRVNPFTGVTVDGSANRERRDSVHAAIAFASSDSIQVTPAIYYQSVEVDDTSSFYTYLSDPGDGELQSGKLLQQWATDRFYVPSLTIATALGLADVVSTTAYIDRSAKAVVDGTNNSFSFWPNPLGPEYPVSYTNARGGLASLAQNVVSEELRVTSRESEARLTWIAGASYLKAHYEEHQGIATAALADGGFINGAAFATRSTEQIGGYGQLSFRVTDRLTATAGLRVEQARYDSQQGVGGISGDPTLQIFDIAATDTLTAPRFNLSFQADPENLFYATVAKGYRMGGPNALVGVACPTETPATYGPDSVWNVELGAKNNLLGGRLRVDSSIFYARWRALQTQVPFPDCGFGFTTNAGEAVSQGVDFGAEALLTERLKVGLTAAFVDAHYTQTVLLNGAVVVGEGDAIGVLPLVAAPWTVTATADYQFPPGEAFAADLHLQNVFHSENDGPFTSDNPDAVVYAPTRRPNPATNQLDFRATARWRSVDVALFVDNVLNSQPTLQRRNYIASDTLFYATTLRPRTVGLSLNWRF